MIISVKIQLVHPYTPTMGSYICLMLWRGVFVRCEECDSNLQLLQEV